MLRLIASFLVRARSVIDRNGWITPTGRWLPLPGEYTHSTYPSYGSPDERVRKGWVRVIIEQPYWSNNETGQYVANFEFKTPEAKSNVMMMLDRVDPDIPFVGLQGYHRYEVVPKDKAWQALSE